MRMMQVAIACAKRIGLTRYCGFNDRVVRRVREDQRFRLPRGKRHKHTGSPHILDVAPDSLFIEAVYASHPRVSQRAAEFCQNELRNQ